MIQMKIPAEVVSDPATFSRLSEECETIIDTKKLLPDFVFRKLFPKYFATEYAVLYNDIASFLFKISRTCGDERVNYMAIDPHPVECYHKLYSWFGLVSFDPSNIVERYAVMHPGGGYPRLLAGVNCGAFWGSSLKWAIVADRFRWELALLAMPDAIDVKELGRFRCFDASMLASYEHCQYKSKDPSGSIASEFMKKFRANYELPIGAPTSLLASD